MSEKLRITDDSWTYGSYHRTHYKKDMLYTFFQYVDIHFIWNVGMGSFSLQDHQVDRLLEKGLISDAQASEYQETALRFLSQMSVYDTWPIEDIYGRVRRIRREVLGRDVLEKDWLQQMSHSQDVDRDRLAGMQTGEIDQRAKKERLLQEKDVWIVALCQPELISQMQQDVVKAWAMGHTVYLLVGEAIGDGLPTRHLMEQMWETMPQGEKMWETMPQGKKIRNQLAYLPIFDDGFGLDLSKIVYEEALQAAVDKDRAALLVYGEEGLIQCRNLRLESIVHAVPYGYHARAMVNQLDGVRPCVVYVPHHFDITRWVKMTEKTQLSYWQLWQLWREHGDGIYQLTPEQLYERYPQYFLNVYESGEHCPEGAAGYQVQVPSGVAESVAHYFDLRDQAIGEYMKSQPGLTYLSTYFTEDMVEVPIPWDSSEPQSGILVHGIRLAAAEKARILHCDPAKTLRQQLRDEAAEAVEENPANRLQLCSNFLFFLTPKLAELYNQLRQDCPREQLREKQGHLDYQLYWQDGHRVESFPLYRKAVLAKKRDGKFLLCQYGLGGGEVRIRAEAGEEVTLSWTAEAVTSVKEGTVCFAETDLDPEIQIYTPYLSRDEEGEGMFANSYRKLVGADRINLVVIQNKLHCIRRGDVVLPSIGVVISLSKQYGQEILSELGLSERENGYFDVDGLSLSIVLDGPDQVDPDQWQQVEWAYGGGLTLIKEGRSIYEPDPGDATEKNGNNMTEMGPMEEHGTVRLKGEGWLSPLSRQTQESALHVLVKHPRTAIGIAKNGDLFVLVFSGRTRMSTGADYQEMCHITRKLIPDVESMMNVDGGGSSVLGMAINGHFMELSYPATSMSSCAGMVRRVNTMLCLEI